MPTTDESTPCPGEAKQRRSYARPILTTLGTVAELTTSPSTAKGGAFVDGNNVFKKQP